MMSAGVMGMIIFGMFVLVLQGLAMKRYHDDPRSIWKDLNKWEDDDDDDNEKED